MRPPVGTEVAAAPRGYVGAPAVSMGAEAARILADPRFVARWLALHRDCPWATPFQHPGFVNTWYASYQGDASPVVVTASSASGELVGLLLLAVYEGRLVAAGAQMAEYQVWLARPDTGAGFGARAIVAARAAVPGLPLHLKYVPADAPLDDVAAAPELHPYVEVIAHPRPLMRVDPSEIAASLKKKSNASRLNRLKREGAGGLERIKDEAALAGVFDAIIALYDFRQGGVNGVCPFAEDPRKKRFHLAWMAAAPEQMHVTVLRTADHVVSALVGVVGRRDLHVAILAHSPFHARHSPGKFHLMFAALELAPAGFQHLDLTPGGAWKERFADTHDQVLEVRIHPGRAGRLLAASRGGARAAAKRLVAAAGMDSRSVARVLAAGSRGGLRDAIRLARQHIKDDVELRVYGRPLATPWPPRGARLPSGVTIRQDSLEDLLRFRPVEPGQSREAFLSASLARLEDGEHVFTVCDGQRLLHHGWVKPADGEVMLADIGQSLALPDVGAVLHDFYTDPAARRHGHCGYALDCALREMARSGTGKRALTWVPAGNEPARRAVEQAGFTYLGSLGRRRRLWRDVCWRTVPDVPSPVASASR